MPGSHWVAISITPKKIYIYDSFARKSKDLLSFLYNQAKLRNMKIIDMNKNSDQQKRSTVCGPISLAWLIMLDAYGVKSAAEI
jgi:hypothetical protein